MNNKLNQRQTILLVLLISGSTYAVSPPLLTPPPSTITNKTVNGGLHMDENNKKASTSS